MKRALAAAGGTPTVAKQTGRHEADGIISQPCALAKRAAMMSSVPVVVLLHSKSLHRIRARYVMTAAEEGTNSRSHALISSVRSPV